MNNEPFVEAVQALSGFAKRQAERGALQAFLGKVKSVEPLEIEVGTTVQRASDGKLYCNPQLLKDYSREMTLDGLTGELQEPGPVTGGKLSVKAAKTTDFGFKAGDNLILLTKDQQVFFILCKEVLLQ